VRRSTPSARLEHAHAAPRARYARRNRHDDFIRQRLTAIANIPLTIQC
jgi:succinate dehydrogenase hydrophobic anchor subunit